MKDRLSNPQIPSNYLDELLSGRSARHTHAWRPLTDIYETETSFVVRSEIGGMSEGDFCVRLENNILTISGCRPDSVERKAFLQMEIHSGEFEIQLEIPPGVQTSQVEADYDDGYLIVTLPKNTPKQIQIRKK